MPMEENLQNDELERFFKNTFEEADQSGGGDVPSDDIWLGIEKGLSPVPAKPVLWMLPSQWKAIAATLAILIVAISAWGIYMYQSKLESQIAEQGDTLDMIEKRIGDIERRNSEVSNATIYKIPKTTYESQTIQEKNFTEVQKKEIANTEVIESLILEELDLDAEKKLKSSISKQKIGLTQIKESTAQIDEVIENNSREEELLQKEKKEDLLETRKSDSFSPIMPLQKLTQEVVLQDTGITLPEVTIPSNKIGSSDWRISANLGPRLDNRKIEQLASIRNFKENEIYTGYALKLGIDRRLNKRFWLSTGIDYSRVYRKSKVDGKINFMMNNEQEVGEELRSIYVLALSTPVNDGEIEVELNRPRNGPSPQNGKEINLEVGLRREVTYVSFPLMIGYDLVKDDRTDLIVQAGMSWTFYEEEFGLERIQARNLPTINHNIGFKNKSRKINDSFGEFVFGLNWSKALDNKWRVHFAPSVRKSWQPLVENDRVVVKNIQLDAQLGISYNF
jgi:hypothetical protein